MARLTRKQRAISEKLVAGKQYAIDEAVALLECLPRAKFAESIDVAINLGVDARKSDQQVRGATTLPHGAGKTVRVAVFTQGANADAAKAAGADVVGMDDLAEQVKAGNMDFDVVVASPDAMRVVGQLGQILGPRGLMPNPKTGTVTPDVATAVSIATGGRLVGDGPLWTEIELALAAVEDDQVRQRQTFPQEAPVAAGEHFGGHA